MMLMNQSLAEIVKQGAVAVEEVKVAQPKHQTPGSTNSSPKKSNQTPNITSNGSSDTYQYQSMNPYYIQQTMYHGQQPGSFMKQIHVVVKNTPFGITLRTNDINRLNFHNYVVKATLLYDSDPPKYVDFIHNEPLQYVATVSEDGSEVTVDVKVGILSSQHQGSLFIVVLYITYVNTPSPSNNEPIPNILSQIGNNSIHSLSLQNLCAVSHPIRIVSKVDHVKKEGIPILKKKTFHEILTDKLKKLQKSQEHQSKWIKNLYDQHHISFDMVPYSSNQSPTQLGSTLLVAANSSTTSTPLSVKGIQNNSSTSTPSFDSICHQTMIKTESSDESQDSDCGQQDNQSTLDYSPSVHHPNPFSHSPISTETNFQNSFNRVVEAYKSVPSDQKLQQIKLMVSLLKSEDLSQLVATFMDELNKTPNQTDNQQQQVQNENDCQCQECPSRLELEKFQGLCMNFLVPPTNTISLGTNPSLLIHDTNDYLQLPIQL
ncbi:putative transcriptional regulator [Tieghemostelium lacteum]|uniref:Putative transcriptional regulator n=1 Tax=Tieghemostelium lacteum TaxID=361077 RepID=A0A151ZG80_TIELA|nr:putative transcriptional regulator [Tieghemostelium lacteum]|eukprot:KYQ92973.1 putative transcriptional regulator [Tieghemostelium lacteum]